MNVRSLVQATSAVLAATGCSDSNFEKREDGVIVFNGEASSSWNMDESRGVFVREGGCVLFERHTGGGSLQFCSKVSGSAIRTYLKRDFWY